MPEAFPKAPIDAVLVPFRKGTPASPLVKIYVVKRIFALPLVIQHGVENEIIEIIVSIYA